MYIYHLSESDLENLNLRRADIFEGLETRNDLLVQLISMGRVQAAILQTLESRGGIFERLATNIEYCAVQCCTVSTCQTICRGLEVQFVHGH